MQPEPQPKFMTCRMGVLVHECPAKTRTLEVVGLVAAGDG